MEIKIEETEKADAGDGRKSPIRDGVAAGRTTVFRYASAGPSARHGWDRTGAFRPLTVAVSLSPLLSESTGWSPRKSYVTASRMEAYVRTGRIRLSGVWRSTTIERRWDELPVSELRPRVRFRRRLFVV